MRTTLPCASRLLASIAEPSPAQPYGISDFVAAYHGNAWRAVYTVRFEDAIYVLHVVRKKSTKGIATPAMEIDLIEQLFAEAERDHRERQN